MINRRKCECGRLCLISSYGDTRKWVCGLCGATYMFTAEEDIEYKAEREAGGLKDVATGGLKPVKIGKRIFGQGGGVISAKVEEVAKKEAEVIVALAEDKTKKDISKEVGINRGAILKIEKEKEKTVEEMKEFLVRENLDVAKAAHEIIKNNEYNKLKTLDGYKLTLAAKIAGQGAIELSGGHLQNVNIINLQALVEKVDSSGKQREKFAEHDENIKKENRDIEEGIVE